MRASLFLPILVLLCIAPVSFAGEASQPRHYTAYNMWYGSAGTIDSLNFQAGTLLPAGTEVRDFAISKAAANPGSMMPAWEGLTNSATNSEPKIVFSTADGKNFEVSFQGKYHPGMSIEDFLARMFTDNELSVMTDGLSVEEKDAIGRGAVIVGMPKKAVLISYGYPPEHRTSSLESNVWRFWMNRFKSKNICFDAKEKAVACETLKKKDL